MRLQDWHNGYSQYLLNVIGTHGKINLKFWQGNWMKFQYFYLILNSGAAYIHTNTAHMLDGLL